MVNQHSGRITLSVIILSLFVMIGMLLPGSGYCQSAAGQKNTAIVDGKKADIKGVLLSRDGEIFVLRDLSRTDTTVVLTDSTKIMTERKGLFRGHKPFDVTALLPGLILRAQGTGDSQGRLVAKDITFSEADLKAAITAYAQTAPIAKKLSETDKKLAETSMEVVDTNKRISSLDQYDVVNNVTLYFDVNKYTLKPQDKALLNALGSKAPGAKNYTVEVKGYTDPTGNFDKNLELSQRRADAVVQYLTVKLNIPLRRITVPMGYGETKPVGNQKTAAGLAEDRRVDVSILVNKGLSQ
jgi:OmpA-OmpF porin, OOP family